MNIIDNELNWRDRELGLAKLQFAASAKGSDLRLYLAKVLILISYSHYEGFVKFCWDIYINHIISKQIKIKNLNPEIKKIALLKIFNTLKNSWNINDFLEHLDDHNSILENVAESIAPLETNSNLWPNLLKENNKKIDINLSTLDANIAKVKKLVGLRNSLAHGEKVEISNTDEILDLAEAAGTLMIDLALQIDDAINNDKYLIPAIASSSTVNYSVATDQQTATSTT